jgi:ribonuclease HI
MPDIIYTDGACLFTGREELSIGCCGYLHNKKLFVDRITINTKSSEMEFKAVFLALQKVKTDTKIYTDCHQVIHALTMQHAKIHSPLQAQTKNLFLEVNKKFELQLQWVKSHADSEGNNTVDQAIEKQMLQHLRRSPKSLREQIYQRAWDKYQIKGAFESFSKEFFVELFEVCKV